MGLNHKGRVKGTKNKRTLKVEEIAAKFDIDPFEVLMMYAAGDWKGLGYDSEVIHKETKDGESVFMAYTISPELRANSAKEAARYLYAHKQSVEVSTGDSGIKIIIEDYCKKS